MDVLLPTELWLQIFGLACTDTGVTGRSISKTCRYFYEVSKPIKLRSVAIQGVASAIAFLWMIEAMPQNERIVENIYMSLHNASQATEEQFEEESDTFQEECRDLAALYDPLFDPKSSTNFPSDDSSQDLVEHRLYLIVRILKAVAQTLRFLTLPFTIFRRSTIFLPLSLPYLRELVLYGDCSRGIITSSSVIALPSLRRLRLSDIHHDNFSEISALAPNLTHLRIDHKSAHSLTLVAALEEHFQHDPSQFSSGEPLKGFTPFPKSLKMLILCSTASSQYMCGYYAMFAQRAMDHLVEREPRIVLFKDSSKKSFFSRVESLEEWLARIDGQLAYWEEARPTKADDP